MARRSAVDWPYFTRPTSQSEIHEPAVSLCQHQAQGARDDQQQPAPERHRVETPARLQVPADERQQEKSGDGEHDRRAEAEEEHPARDGRRQQRDRCEQHPTLVALRVAPRPDAGDDEDREQDNGKERHDQETARVHPEGRHAAHDAVDRRQRADYHHQRRHRGACHTESAVEANPLRRHEPHLGQEQQHPAGEQEAVQVDERRQFPRWRRRRREERPQEVSTCEAGEGHEDDRHRHGAEEPVFPALARVGFPVPKLSVAKSYPPATARQGRGNDHAAEGILVSRCAARGGADMPSSGMSAMTHVPYLNLCQQEAVTPSSNRRRHQIAMSAPVTLSPVHWKECWAEGSPDDVRESVRPR